LVIAGPAPGLAVNVTLVPAQMVVALADKVGVGTAFTVIVMPALVTGHAGTEPVVAITVTTSVFTSRLLVYILLRPFCLLTPLTWKS
jgi:hypothetical protein